MLMPAKKIDLQVATQEKLLSGVEQMAKVVGSTLGPMGKNVIIETQYGATTVTKDGVTVAKHLTLEDPTENLAVTIVRQAADRTANLAGDGTTTSTVIAAALVKQAFKLIKLGFQPIEIKRTFEDLLHKVRLNLVKNASPVSSEDILKIATISANNDETIGALIHSAFEYVGKEGLITLGDSKTGKTEVELVPGASVNKGYASPYFITDAAKGEAILEKPLIYITDNKLRTLEDVVPVLEAAHESKRPVLIICDSIDGHALQILAVNKIKGIVRVAAIEGPSFGENRAELLKDLAAITSSKILSNDTANTDFGPHYLGSAEKVVVSKERTVFVEPKKDNARVEERIALIKEQLNNVPDNPYLTSQYQKRLADLAAKVATINVGAATETEQKEVKDRVDDALRATSAAVAKGYLVGGGLALLWAAQELTKKDPTPIVNAFVDGLTEPLRLIIKNSGKTAEAIIERILEKDEPDFGFNAKTQEFDNLRDRGIIDPLLVVEQAITNAVSAANMLILAEVSLTNVDRTPPYAPPQMDYA